MRSSSSAFHAANHVKRIITHARPCQRKATLTWPQLQPQPLPLPSARIQSIATNAYASTSASSNDSDATISNNTGDTSVQTNDAPRKVMCRIIIRGMRPDQIQLRPSSVTHTRTTAAETQTDADTASATPPSESPTTSPLPPSRSSRLLFQYFAPPRPTRFHPSRRNRERHRALAMDQASRRDAGVPASEAPQSILYTWIRRMFGMDVLAHARAILEGMMKQVARKEWEEYAGFGELPNHRGMSHVPESYATLMHLNLSALHIWMIHVRLRQECIRDPSVELPRPLLRTLFDLYWNEIGSEWIKNRTTLRQVQENIYGMWYALDTAWMQIIQGEQQDEAGQELKQSTTTGKAQQQSTSSMNDPASLSSDTSSSHYAPFPPARFDHPASNMISVLWRNCFHSSITIHPAHAARLLDYIRANLEYLTEVPIERIKSGQFQWIVQPPRTKLAPLTDKQQSQLFAYYQLLTSTGMRNRPQSRAMLDEDGNDGDGTALRTRPTPIVHAEGVPRLVKKLWPAGSDTGRGRGRR